MKIEMRINQCRFGVELTSKQVNNYSVRAALAKSNILTMILNLNEQGVILYEYSPYVGYDYSILKDEAGKYRLSPNKRFSKELSFSSVLTAIDSIFESPKFEVNKTYRIIYNAGERAGAKRAIKVNKVTPSLIDVEDLSIGEPRKYLLSRISDIEEFTI